MGDLAVASSPFPSPKPPPLPLQRLLSLSNPSFRCSPWAEVWGRCDCSFGEGRLSGEGRFFGCAPPVRVGEHALIVKAILFSGGLARARWGACGPALFREGRGFGSARARRGVSMRVVSVLSRAYRDSTTARCVRALGERVRGCDLSY